MSLVISKVFTYDTDAGNYIQAVEAADEAASPGIGALEPAVRQAINNFVVGCKQDGIWNAIKASCILAGAKTRQGALVPLRNEYDFFNNLQPAPPQSFGFVDANYNRKTGLVGNGSTKYLDSNRSNTADPKDNAHFSCYGTTFTPVNLARLMGSETVAGQYGKNILFATSTTSFLGAINSGLDDIGKYSASGFVGMSRTSSTIVASRNNNTSTFVNRTVATWFNSGNVFVFGTNAPYGADRLTSSRLAFYSIGESLDLAKLDSRVTDLIAAFNNPLVIP